MTASDATRTLPTSREIEADGAEALFSGTAVTPVVELVSVVGVVGVVGALRYGGGRPGAHLSTVTKVLPASAMAFIILGTISTEN